MIDGKHKTYACKDIEHHDFVKQSAIANTQRNCHLGEKYPSFQFIH